MPIHPDVTSGKKSRACGLLFMPFLSRFFSRTILLFTLLILLTLILGCTGQNGYSPLAHHGILDLSTVRNMDSQLIRLDGEWEFYWKKLLSPADLQGAHPPSSSTYISLPGAWNNTRIAGKKIGARGFATLRLTVLSDGQERDLVLHLENVHCAYKLWVNNTLLAQNGQVGTELQEETVGSISRNVKLTTHKQTMELVLQVSNFHHGRGGFIAPIRLGPEIIMHSTEKRWQAQILFCIGLVFIMGLYHFGLFCLLRKERAPLYFSLYCLLWAGYLLTANHYNWVVFLIVDRSQISYALLNRVQMICFTLSLPFVFSFLRALYPKEFHRFVERLVWSLALIFAAMALVSPIPVTSAAIPKYYFLFRALVIAYNQIMLVMAMYRKREGAVFLVVGYIVLILFGINDMLYDHKIIRSIYLSHIGLFIFILAQALALSAKMSRAFSAVERLLSEQQQHIRELSRIDRLKDVFLSTTSHELRTPLNGIIGLTESLASGVAGPLNQQVRDNLAMIAASGRRLHNLVDDILDFSRLKYKDIRLHLRPVDLHAVVDTVLAVSKPLVKDKPLALYNKVPKTISPVAADEDRLQQIFFNLVGNAIKFSDQGEVVVSAVENDGEIEIVVKDSGIGIPSGKLETIFDAFAQVDDSSARNYSGAGLGLGISRHLVELHGGHLWAESTPGVGSSFRFTLPLSTEIISPMPSDHPPAEVIPMATISTISEQTVLPAPDAPHILAVDDDPINLQVVRNHLGLAKMTVTVAANGKQALALIEQGHVFDLVLLDVMMPKMTGFEVCRALRHRYNPAELPVIMLTAKNQLADLTEGLECGANDYLRKPFAGEELVARVRTQLKVRKSHKLAQENKQLKREVELRTQSELELRLTQQRLAGMLHAVPDAIMAINENQEIGFCNQVFTKQFGYEVQNLLGNPFAPFFSPSAVTILDNWLRIVKNGEDSLPLDGAHLELIDAEGLPRPSAVIPAALELGDEYLLMLLIGTRKQAVASRLWLEEFFRNRQRLQQLEVALTSITPQILTRQPALMDDLHAMDRSLERMSQEILSPLPQEDQRTLIVKTLRLALDLWTETTQSSKIDLAHQSGLWAVYVNKDGWERTQTLDRYLSIDTLPANPRLQNVFATCEYVLAATSDDTPLRRQLSIYLEQLRSLGIH